MGLNWTDPSPPRSRSSITELPVPVPNDPIAHQVSISGATVRLLTERLDELWAVAVACGRRELAETVRSVLRALDRAERRAWYAEQLALIEPAPEPAA